MTTRHRCTSLTGIAKFLKKNGCSLIGKIHAWRRDPVSLLLRGRYVFGRRPFAMNRMKMLIRADRPIKAAANAHLLLRASTIATMPTKESTPTIHHCKRQSVGLSARSRFARNW